MGALFQYMQLTQRLLADQRQVGFSPADLIAYINVARGQVAGAANCIRVAATLPLVVSQRAYPFSSIVLGSAPGVAGVLHVRMSSYQVGTGQKYMQPRPFEWFNLYELNTAVPKSGPPKQWTQYGQGAIGSIYVSPLPDIAYTLNLDTCCYPLPLAVDTDPEAIPFPWTDAVPFFATWYALSSRTDEASMKSADLMMKRYGEFMQNARTYANPSVNPMAYEQARDPTALNKLGVQIGNVGGQG